MNKKAIAVTVWLVLTSAICGLLTMIVVVSSLSRLIEWSIVRAVFDTKLGPEIVFFAGCFLCISLQNNLFAFRKSLYAQLVLSLAGYTLLKFWLWRISYALS